MYVCMVEVSPSGAVAVLYDAVWAARSEAGHVDLPVRVRHREQGRQCAGERYVYVCMYVCIYVCMYAIMFLGLYIIFRPDFSFMYVWMYIYVCIL